MIGGICSKCGKILRYVSVDLCGECKKEDEMKFKVGDFVKGVGKNYISDYLLNDKLIKARVIGINEKIISILVIDHLYNSYIGRLYYIGKEELNLLEKIEKFEEEMIYTIKAHGNNSFILDTTDEQIKIKCDFIHKIDDHAVEIDGKNCI